MAIIDQVISDKYALYNGDCVDVMRGLPKEKIHMALFSPPFADLYTYSDSPNDLGNCRSYDEFFEHFKFVTEQINRVLLPGRICAVHCMDLPSHKGYDGEIGIKDFSGDLIRAMSKSGFMFHSRHVIWTDPLIAATRTKALGLMHKQLVKDSTMCRAGLQTYLLAFRKIGDNPIPVSHPNGLQRYCGSDDPSVGHSGEKKSHHIWRSYASPVWMDIRQTLTLEVKHARDPEDEKHVCPLQLDVIERACILWSNPGETVLTPFMGIGSEVYGAIINGRRGIGIELKPTYYKQAVKNVACASEKTSEMELFSRE